MMMSWHGSTFHIAGPLWGESTDHQWIPLTKGQWCGALMFPLFLAWTNCWTNNRVPGDLRCLNTHVTNVIHFFSHDTYVNSCALWYASICILCYPYLPLIRWQATAYINYGNFNFNNLKFLNVNCEEWILTNLYIICSITVTYFIMSAMESQITSLMIVYSTIYSGADQRKHQSSISLAFVQGIHRWPVNSPHKGPVTQKMFPFDDIIMNAHENTRKLYKNLGVFQKHVKALKSEALKISMLY